MAFGQLPLLTGNNDRDVRNLWVALQGLQRDLLFGDIRQDPAGSLSANGLQSENTVLETLRKTGSLSNLSSTDFDNFSVPDIPDVPTGLTVTGGMRAFYVAWNTPNDPTIKGWVVQRADNSGFTTNPVKFYVKSPFLIDAPFLGGTVRYYRVAAIRDNGAFGSYTSGSSATVTIPASPSSSRNSTQIGITTDNTWTTTIVSTSLLTRGGPVTLDAYTRFDAQVACNVLDELYIRIKRDGSVINTFAAVLAGTTDPSAKISVSGTYLDNAPPSAAVHIYTLECKQIRNGGNNSKWDVGVNDTTQISALEVL